MTYEEYLVALRHARGIPTGDLRRVGQRKQIAADIKANRQLTQWLSANAGGISMVTQHADAIAVVEQLKATGKIIGIDIETAKVPGNEGHPQAGLHQKLSRIRLVQLFHSRAEGVFVIDCFATGYEWLQHLVGGHYVAHNAKFECSHLWHHLKQEVDIECTMLAGRVFDDRNLALDDYTPEYLELTLPKRLQTSAWSRQPLLDEQIIYAACDAVAVKLLWDKFGTMFAERDGTYHSAYRFLKSLIYPVVRQAGIKLDQSEHAKLVAEWQKDEQTARQQLKDLGLINPGSIPQRQDLLERRLSEEELADWPRTDTGNLSTKADHLENALHIPGAEPLAKWSRASTRLSNFGQKLSKLLIDGCLYPNYSIAGIVTGRFGCSNPNFQNLPREGFKHVVVAPPGHQFVTCDLSQIELRVAGLISGDPVINAAYANGRDLHREVAAERAGKSPEDVTKEERQAAKAINFGLIFGAGANTLRQQAINSYGVDMTMEEAQQAKAFFHSKYPRLTEWQQEAVREADSKRYSESPYIRLTRHYDRRVYTHAMNFPVQSGAWELLALAIIYIDQRLPDDGSIRISHHVYDELCLLARDDQVMTAALLLRDGFRHGFLTVFPDAPTVGLVEIGAGKTWEQAGQDSHRIREASL